MFYFIPELFHTTGTLGLHRICVGIVHNLRYFLIALLHIYYQFQQLVARLRHIPNGGAYDEQLVIHFLVVLILRITSHALVVMLTRRIEVAVGHDVVRIHGKGHLALAQLVEKDVLSGVVQIGLQL